MRKRTKVAQVWVETVIYTLIGLAIIGILLAVAKPKIDSMKDRLVVEQTIESMNEIDGKIREVYQKGPGNKRVLDLKISKGKLFIDATANQIYWVLDSDYQYSELDTPVPIGTLSVITRKGDEWEVTLSVDYDFDLMYESAEELKEVDAVSVPYALSVENLGLDGGDVVVDLRVS